MELPSSRPLLLVDDEDGIRVVLSALLADMGYAVRVAAGGEEALELFRASRPAIVMTDIKMPGMDGIGLLRGIKALDPAAEVLMLTGHGDMELAVTSLRLGAGDFLNKPVSEQALEVALDRAKERIALREALRRHTEELEALVAERTGELIRTERFAAVGETAAGLAHAIKNIAGALDGTMYVLEKSLELGNREHLEEGWRMIRSDIARLHRLAVAMLELGRPVRHNPHEVEPVAVARNVLTLAVSRAGEAGARLELLDDAGPGPVRMPEEAVHQCLLNLVLNALESFDAFGAPGTPAFILSKPSESNVDSADTRQDLANTDTEAYGCSPLERPVGSALAAHIASGPGEWGEAAVQSAATGVAGSGTARLVTVRITREGGREGGSFGEKRLCYRIVDNGPGFPEATGERPEQAFHSGKETGSGIGLFATRKIAHEIGAELRFAARPGGGTECTLLLPAESASV